MMRPPGWDAWRICAIALTCLVSGGCSAFTSGKGLNPFEHTHRLSDTAEELREANPGILHLPRELARQPLPPYTVEPGDVLSVQPVDAASPVRLPADQTVLSDGTIQLGEYGQVQVFGRTLPEVEGIVHALVTAKTPGAGAITARLVSRAGRVFYVLGEVNAPGAFPLHGRETVLDAILAAGGLTQRAAHNNIVLSRPSHPEECRTVLPVCYDQIVQLGDTTTNYQIAPGDRVFVPGKTLAEKLFGDDDSCSCGVHVPCVAPAARIHAECLPTPPRRGTIPVSSVFHP
jgi:polysaccharide biosynthesis/export protein